MKIFAHGMGALVVFLSALIPLAAVTPQLHLTFARHGHFFCARHHVLEDLPVSDVASPGPPARGAAEGPGLRNETFAGTALAHVPCISADLSLKLSGTPSAVRAVDTAALFPEGLTSSSSDFVPGSRISLAPKQSPPVLI